ncbi:MAG: hypothetical protein AAGG08_16290, partial [Actinomycetota bacterium]
MSDDASGWGDAGEPGAASGAAGGAGAAAGGAGGAAGAGTPGGGGPQPFQLPPDAVGTAAAVDLAQRERERRQRMFVVGLASVGALVLVIGLVAFLLSGGDDTTTTPVTTPSDPPSTSLSATTGVTASTTTTTSSSTTSTPTTTTIPIPSTIDAGADLLVSAGQVVTLTAVDVGDTTPDEFVRWIQTAGPDVTAGVGALGGPTVSFTAPDEIGHLGFELRVADPASDPGTTTDTETTDTGTTGTETTGSETTDTGTSDAETTGAGAETTDTGTTGDGTPATSAVDELIVRIVEDAATAVFVDGERGDDAAAGTIDAPVRTLAAGVARGGDLHVRSVGRYDEAAGTLVLGDGIDLRGGYDADWLRDPGARTIIDGAARAVRVTGEEDRVIASVEVLGGSAAAGEAAVAIEIVDATVRIEDSRVVSGTAGAGTVEQPAGGVSVAVSASDADRLEIVRTTINAGAGGAGWSGATESGPARGPAAPGQRADGPNGADGAGDGRTAGGSGGDGGVVGDGETSPSGARGGTAGSPDGQSGRGGAGGQGGAGGAGASGTSDPLLGRGAVGGGGSFGESGVGGGGGGGGASL